MQNIAMEINASTRDGDLTVSARGLSFAPVLQTAVLCCLYGGNPDSSETGEYWGNAFLSIPFISQTQRALTENVLPQDIENIRLAVFDDASKLTRAGLVSEVIDVLVTQTSERAVKIALFLRTNNTIEKVEV